SARLYKSAFDAAKGYTIFALFAPNRRRIFVAQDEKYTVYTLNNSRQYFQNDFRFFVCTITLRRRYAIIFHRSTAKTVSGRPQPRRWTDAGPGLFVLLFTLSNVYFLLQ
ncbi:MAG: hypothetical protein IJU32_01040, partial [Pyramidobacter sp.]|nr:hypothetical protein [Pyramidobacter sp.]